MANNRIIGIDLGTTNCTMAYCDKSDPTFTIHQFEIPQVISAGISGQHFSLPSFIYFPLDEEIAAGQIQPYTKASSPCTVGIFARDRGGEVPARMIASAKSWLCHDGIDRREALLPVNEDSDESKSKMSPLEACAELLGHMKWAWESRHKDSKFTDQQIFITVPASFDPSARQLVEEAAQFAEYPPIVLLEEPQSAFYAWLHKNHHNWRDLLQVGDRILVVDIGGGTTDFSLISVEETLGDLTLNRVAVGSHLLLGGDNIDLALAYFVKNKLEVQGHAIDDWQLNALTHSCRVAKEKLFSATPVEKIDVTIMGRGKKLIGNSLTAAVSLKEAQELIINGFMPLVDIHERSTTEKRSGLQQMGLPFAQDPRITCQLAKFLSMTGENDHEGMDAFVMPTAVLFNGGTMKAAAFRERIIDQLNHWSQQLNKNGIKVLKDDDLDYAVSRGAVYYGLSQNGQAIRIKSGASRSFYIGVEESAPAVPGILPSLKAICIVPFGMEEGSQQDLPDQEFALVVGEPTMFRFFSHASKVLSNGIEPKIGTIVRNWKQELTELPSIETHLDCEEVDGKVIRVKLMSKMTELGVLELWCVAKDDRRWKLEFETRNQG